MSTFDLDPFTLVYDALWELLDSSARLRELVKAGNRINLNRYDDRHPIKEEVSSADLPELIIIPVSGGETKQTSGARILVQRYRIILSTCEQRVNQDIVAYNF